MAAGNADFDQILSTTLKNYIPKLADNVFTARPLFYALTNGQTIRRISGGAKIVVPIIYGTNSTAGSYAGDDTIAITAQTGISAAEYSWKQYAASVTITGIEEAKNSGDADNAWWRSSLTNVAGALTLAGMSTMYNNISVGNDQPTIIISDQDEYEKYESLLQPNLRYTSAQVADAGFQNLLFKGAPCTYDSDTNLDGKMFFLNTKYIRLVAHTETWFQPTPFVRPTNQDARYAQILCYGELTTSNRARQGMLYGLTD